MGILGKLGLDSLGAVFSPITEWVKAWQERKTAQLKHKQQIEKARAESKIAMLKSAQNHKFEWEEQAVKNAGWKDDWFVLVLTAPAILVFWPDMQPTVKSGFEALKELPEWYRYALLIAIGSSFGVKKITDWKKIKGLLG